MIVYVMGPSCAGKSTWVKNHRTENSLTFDFDAVAKVLGSDRDHDHEGEIKDLTFTIRDDVERRILEGYVKDAYVIRSKLTQQEIEEYGAAGVRFVVLDPGKETVMARAKKERPPWAIKRIEEWYEDPPQVESKYLLERSKELKNRVEEELSGTLQRTGGSIQADADKGIIEGIGISYVEAYETQGFVETFAPGCVEPGSDIDVLSLRDHDISRIAGRVISTEDTPEGRKVRVELASTQLGDESRQLARDGLLTSFSVSFVSIDHDVREIDGKLHIRHNKIEVKEYSLTSFPAYATAKISGVRTENQGKGKAVMSQLEDVITRTELDAATADIMARVEDVERRTVSSKADGNSAILERSEVFDSFGDFVKAVTSDRHAQHDDATQLYRDITTANIPVAAQEQAGWLGDLTRKLEARRPWAGIFDSRPLPAKGMTVDYIKTTKVAKVGKQENQLDNLVKGFDVKNTTGRADVVTYGGANTLAQQVIDRMEASVVSDMFEAMAFAYGSQTEAAIKAYAVAEIDKKLTAHESEAAAGHAVEVPTTFDAFGWVDAIATAAELFDERAYNLEHLAVSKDIFIKLASLKDGAGRPMMNLFGAGSNIVGELNLPKALGNLLGMPVRVLSGTEGKALFFDSIAIRNMESPGSPFHLQKSNVLNLSQDFSVYGYMAHMTPYPDALLPIKFTG